MKNFLALFLCLIAVLFCLTNVVSADQYEAPHTEGWTRALEQMQSGIDRIYNMILELFKALGDKLIDIKDKFRDKLNDYYQHLRDMIQNIFDFYNGEGSYTQGFFDRFKDWFKNFWEQFFPPPQPSDPPSSPPGNRV